MAPTGEEVCASPSVAGKVSPGQFPEPMTIPPQLEHRQTFIILHGRGSTGPKFGPPLLETATSAGENLQSAFPHAKIIFLTASRNRAAIYKRSYTHQWFDCWHLEERTKRQDLMRAGLRKSCAYVHATLQREIESVGEKSVVLWGLSQGCATSLIALLTWDGRPFAAVVGMCGHLPFANHMEDIARNSGAGSDEDDPFSRSGDESDDGGGGDLPDEVDQDPGSQVVQFLRAEIDVEDKVVGMVFRDVPVFLGHGTEDDKVVIEIGREAKSCLDRIGADVKMVEYEGLGHWYSGEMLGDIFDFLREKLCTQQI